MSSLTSVRDSSMWSGGTRLPPWQAPKHELNSEAIAKLSYSPTPWLCLLSSIVFVTTRLHVQSHRACEQC